MTLFAKVFGGTAIVIFIWFQADIALKTHFDHDPTPEHVVQVDDGHKRR